MSSRGIPREDYTVELFDQSGTVEQLREMVAEFERQPKIGSILIFACDANGFMPDTIDPILKETGLIVFGGVFPQIIYDGV